MPKYHCGKCQYLHIFTKKQLENFGNKFTCRVCGTVTILEKKEDKK